MTASLQPSSCIFINNCSFTYLSLRYKFPVTASVRGHRINAAFWNAKRELDNFTYLVTNVTVTDTLSSLRRRWQLTDTLDKAHCRYEHTHTHSTPVCGTAPRQQLLLSTCRTHGYTSWTWGDTSTIPVTTPTELQLQMPWHTKLELRQWRIYEETKK